MNCQDLAGCTTVFQVGYPTTTIQNIRLVRPLGIATGKGFNIYFCLLHQRDQKTTISANRSPGERILIFGLCLFWHLKWIFHIGTLLETIDIVLETYFEFGFHNGSVWVRRVGSRSYCSF